MVLERFPRKLGKYKGILKNFGDCGNMSKDFIRWGYYEALVWEHLKPYSKSCKILKCKVLKSGEVQEFSKYFGGKSLF